MTIKQLGHQVSHIDKKLDNLTLLMNSQEQKIEAMERGQSVSKRMFRADMWKEFERLEKKLKEKDEKDDTRKGFDSDFGVAPTFDDPEYQIRAIIKCGAWDNYKAFRECIKNVI